MRRRTIKDDGPDPIDRYVGSRVRTRRVGLRISQTKLGEAVGVTFQQVQKYENGANRIGASNLYKIAKTLGVEISYFYDGVEAMPDADQPQVLSDLPQVPLEKDPMSSREAIEMMHNFYRITDESVRTRLAQFVKSLAQYGK
jgi:transcriptional regulator with XRE-family HTH domain